MPLSFAEARQIAASALASGALIVNPPLEIVEGKRLAKKSIPKPPFPTFEDRPKTEKLEVQEITCKQFNAFARQLKLKWRMCDPTKDRGQARKAAFEEVLELLEVYSDKKFNVKSETSVPDPYAVKT